MVIPWFKKKNLKPPPKFSPKIMIKTKCTGKSECTIDRVKLEN